MRTKTRVSAASPAPVLRLKYPDSPTFGMPDPPPRAPSDSFRKSNFLTFQSNEVLELKVRIAGAPQLLIGDAETAFNMAQVNGYFKEQSPQEPLHRGGRVASMTRSGMVPERHSLLLADIHIQSSRLSIPQPLKPPNGPPPLDMRAPANPDE
jgi:hypothetical protein